MTFEQSFDSYFRMFIEVNTKKSKNEVTSSKSSCLSKYKQSLPKNFYYSLPNSILLKLTSDCNLRCKHCFYSNTPEKYNQNLDYTFREVLALVDFLVKDLNILSLIYTGGEPFLRKDFLEIVEYTKQYYLPLIIQTNGTLINKNTADALAVLLDYKTDLIQISLEGGNKDTHEQIRGSGTFNKTIDAIKMLRANGIPVQINTTITSVNAPTLCEILELCKKLNVTKLSVNHFNVCHEKHRYLELTPEDNLHYNYKIFKESLKYPEIFVILKSFDLFDFLKIPRTRKIVDDYISKNKIPYNPNKCVTCHNHNKLTIDSKGNVLLCSMDESKDAILGNLREQNFYDIWENRFNTPYFQKRDMSTTKCRNCKYIPLCNTGCMASAYKKYGDINCAAAECTYFEEYMRLKNG